MGARLAVDGLLESDSEGMLGWCTRLGRWTCDGVLLSDELVCVSAGVWRKDWKALAGVVGVCGGGAGVAEAVVLTDGKRRERNEAAEGEDGNTCEANSACVPVESIGSDGRLRVAGATVLELRGWSCECAVFFSEGRGGSGYGSNTPT